jgi:hypothetical protein
MKYAKHIAFSKVGKSIKFKGNGSSAGGEIEPPALFRALANNNPDIMFYLIGRSDYSRLTDLERSNLFLYNNVTDCYAEKPKDISSHLEEFFSSRGIVLDAHIAMPGQIGTVTIPGKIQQIKHPELMASVIDMTKNYTTPIISYWNDHPELKTIEIITDPRYTFDQSRDIIQDPSVSLGQYNYEYTKSTIESYENQVRVERQIKVTYDGIETNFMYGLGKPNKNRERSIPFMVVLNEGNPSRYKFLDEWVLSGIDDVEVYGKWEDERTLNDSRFKGSISWTDLHAKLNNVRASFAIPIAPGWVTSKYVELIHSGVIPILHPTYDTQNNLDYPDILRPKSIQDMKKLIELVKDDKFYTKMIDHLQSKYCKPEYYDGTFLSKRILSHVYDNYELPNKTAYSENTVKKPKKLF